MMMCHKYKDMWRIHAENKVQGQKFKFSLFNEAAETAEEARMTSVCFLVHNTPQ